MADTREDEKLKRGDEIDQRYQEMLNNHPDAAELRRRENKAISDYAQGGTKQADTSLNDPSKNINSVSEKENQFGYERSEKSSDNRTRRAKAVSFFKSKKGATTTIIGGTGIGGTIILSIVGSLFNLFPSISANATETNDSRSHILEKRLYQAIKKKFGSGNDEGCSISKYKCKLGRMPTKMINRLAEEGIVASDEHGNPVDRSSSDRGYAKKNPTHYRIEDSSAKNGFRVISSAEIPNEFAKNAVFRANFKRAYNMRFRAWTGRTIKKIFYDRFNLKQNGGVIAGDENQNQNSIDDELDNLEDSDKAQENTPDGVEKPPTTEDEFKAKFKGFITNAFEHDTKSSDLALTGLAIMCTAKEFPVMVADMYRGIQLAQILLLVNDAILSPAGKIKAGDATGGEVSALGSKLTETVKGKSALDSAILQSALGINKNKTATSKYAPGYSMYESSFVQKAVKMNASTKGACNKINSPEGQLAANSIELALDGESFGLATLLTKGGGLALKVLGGAKLIEFILSVPPASTAISLAAKGVFKLVEKFAGNYIKGARGLALGDALGTGLFAYFSISGLSSGSGVLKKSQVGGYTKAMAEVDNQYRQEDIATLSPFDTSSQYTFLGSIVSNLSYSGLFSGGVSSRLSSLGSIVMGMSSNLLSPIAGATTDEDVQAAEARCDHGDMYGLKDLAIDAAGTPCVGIPEQYLDMSVDEVYDTAVSNNDDIDPNSGDWTSDDEIGKRQADCQDGSLTAIAGCGITNKDEAVNALYQYDKNINDILDGSDDDTTTTASSEPSTFTVASFNMCQEINHPIGQPSMCKNLAHYGVDEKRQKEAATITGTGAAGNPQFDIVGTQETSIPTQEAVLNQDSNYESFPSALHPYKDSKLNLKSVPSSNGKAIFWNTDKFTYTSGGLLYGVCGNGASHGDNKAGRADDSFPWVQLTSSTGQIVYFMSVHTPNNGYGCPKGHASEDRIKDAKKIVSWAKTKAIENNLVIITGDMNTGKDGKKPPLYCTMTSDGILQHAVDMTASKDTDDNCPTNGLPIDQIYSSTNINGLTAQGWNRLGGTKSYDAGTDHSPAWVTYNIPGAEGSSSENDSSSTSGGDQSLLRGDEGYKQNCARLGAPCDGECVSFVKYELLLHKTKYHGGSMGNGGAGASPGGVLDRLGYKIDHNPAVNSILGMPGHTGVVAAVDPGKSITISDYNYSSDHDHQWHLHKFSWTEAEKYWYAHTEVDWQ